MTYAIVEERAGRHVVVAIDAVTGTRAVIGRHAAKYRATEQANSYNRGVTVAELTAYREAQR